MTRHFKALYSAFYMLTIHTTLHPHKVLSEFVQNVIITDRKHVCQCLQKHNFLIRDKNNVAFFTKCVPVLPVRGSHSFTGHHSFQNTFMSGKRRFLCLRMVYIGGSDTIK